MKVHQKKIHYSWYILVCCILVNIVVHAPVLQINNLYIVPMQQDFQVSRTLLTLECVVMAAGAVVTAPLWGKLYKKYDARILLSLCTVITALCIIGRSFMPNVWGMLALAVIKGISFTGNTALPNSILLTAWFKKRRGFAISTASLGISVGGVIFSPLVGQIISTWGWRASDRVVGAIMLIVMLPCTALIIRSTPKDKGLQPFGAEQEEGAHAPGEVRGQAMQGMTFKEARSSPVLWIFLIAVFGMTFTTGAALQMPTYLNDIGWASISAMALSVYSLIGIGGKLLLGIIVDKLGEKKSSLYICGMSIIAFLGFILARNPVALAIMVVSYGLSSGIASVMPPLLTSYIFGKRDYGPIYGMVLSVNRFGGVIGTMLVSMLYDITQSYTVIWPACVLSMGITLAAILYCINRTKKEQEIQQSN